MSTLVHKVQVLLDDVQYQALRDLARQRQLSLSSLLREAVVDRLVEEARRAQREKAFRAISEMNLPVSDWPEMEAEIERARLEGLEE